MNRPPQLEFLDHYAAFRPRGHVSLEGGTELIATAIASARERGVRKILVNTVGLTGFDMPTMSERYVFARACAEASSGFVRIAMVARAELIDPQKFGVTVAANRDVTGDVFVSEEEAVAWLESLG